MWCLSYYLTAGDTFWLDNRTKYEIDAFFFADEVRRDADSVDATGYGTEKWNTAKSVEEFLGGVHLHDIDNGLTMNGYVVDGVSEGSDHQTVEHQTAEEHEDHVCRVDGRRIVDLQHKSQDIDTENI